MCVQRTLRRSASAFIGSLLREQVAAMPRTTSWCEPSGAVEKYSDQEAWNQLVSSNRRVGPEVRRCEHCRDSDQDAKQFDLLMLSLHLTVLRVDAMRLDAPGAALLIAIHR